ncbi:MAG: hypothetical protein GPOALKHO_001837 [Sodalis sp.]|nr:MAG: hypothetical protein GPOALKHO_001837 [Sodalis sp.]
MQHPPTVLLIAHIDKINNNAAEITQSQLARNGLRNICVEDRFVEIAVTDKGACIDIDSRHRFSLINDQIAAGFKLDAAVIL